MNDCAVFTTKPFIRLAVAIFLLPTSGCLLLLLNPNRAAMTAARRQVRLVSDSPEVRRLIAEQEAFQLQEKTEIDRFHADSASLEQKWFRDANLEALRQLRELGQHPDRYIPERIAFLDAMARAPGVTVSGESYCRIINRSKAMCDRHPGPNPTYFKVRISIRPSKGQEGWGCLGEDIRLNGALAF